MSSTYPPHPPNISSSSSSNPSLKEPPLKQMNSARKNISSGPAESSAAARKAAKSAKDDEALLSAARKSKCIVAQQTAIPLDLGKDAPHPDADTTMAMDDPADPSDDDVTSVDLPMVIASDNPFDPLHLVPASPSQTFTDGPTRTAAAAPSGAPLPEDHHIETMAPGAAEFIEDFRSQYNHGTARPQVQDIDEALRLGLILPSDVARPPAHDDDPFATGSAALASPAAQPPTVLSAALQPVPMPRFLRRPQAHASPSAAANPPDPDTPASPLPVTYAAALIHTPTSLSGSSTAPTQMSRLAMRLGAANLNAPVPLHAQAASITTALYTNGPFPIIHDAHPLAALAFISRSQLFDWENIQGAKFVTRPFDLARNPLTHAATASLIQRVVLEVANFADAHVAAPVLTITPQQANYAVASTPFLVFNITDAVAHIMLSRGVWSSTNITFQALTIEPGLPHFLFTIAGFTTSDTATVRTIVHNQWNSEDSQHALVAIAVETATPEATLDDDQIIAFMTTLRVERIDTMGRGALLLPRFNIYADPAGIPSEEHWYALRRHFRDLPYVSNLYGIGRAQDNMLCSICRGVDHPRGLCPFPDVVGWNGPSRDTPSMFNRGGFRGGFNGRRGRGSGMF